MRQFILKFILTVTLVACAYAGDLIDCPDCGSPVSERAIMCPQCGCPASGIFEAVEMKHAAAKLLAPRPVVKVQSDKATGYAIAVSGNNKRYLVADSALMDGAASLSITLLATNTSVRYLSFQFAKNKPLVRFYTDSTNLVFLDIAPEVDLKHEKDFIWLAPDIFNDCIYTGKVTVSGSFELVNSPERVPLVALSDVETNIIGVVCGINDKQIMVTVTDEIDWVTVRPLDYRNQTKLLVEADKAVKEGRVSRDIMERLDKTEWLTNILEKRANKLLMNRVSVVIQKN